MKIREYLDKYNYIIKDIADHTGRSWQYIWRVASGRVNPSVSLAHQISAWSKGEIKVHEIRKCTTSCAPGCSCSQEK